MKIILASSSPRRMELIKKLNCEVECISPDTDEKFDDNKSLEENILCVAASKGMAVKAFTDLKDDQIIIAADTSVVIGETAMGKPKNSEDARLMLRALSGRTHEVITSVFMMNNARSISFYEKTKVTFSPMSDSEIDYYISTGEPFGKAGAYAIQGAGALFIESLEGDYYNVVGLPVNRIYNVLKNVFKANVL